MFNPLCELCLAQGKVTPATDVHHNYSFLNIDGSINYDRCYDYGNLISLCHLCHSKIHKLYGRTEGEVGNLIYALNREKEKIISESEGQK